MWSDVRDVQLLKSEGDIVYKVFQQIDITIRVRTFLFHQRDENWIYSYRTGRKQLVVDGDASTVLHLNYLVVCNIQLLVHLVCIGIKILQSIQQGVKRNCIKRSKRVQISALFQDVDASHVRLKAEQF